jgi:hypothetical protein
LQDYYKKSINIFHETKINIMTQEQEKQLLEAIYERFYEAVTYQPSGGKNPFNDSEIFIHFSKNAALETKSFQSPRTPSNPLGDLKSSEEFSRMVDRVSPMSLEWNDSGMSLSDVYGKIIRGANAATKKDSKSQEMYLKAYNYLHPEKKEKNPFTDEVTTVRTDGEDYVNYENNMSDYVAAIMAYRLSYSSYLEDLESNEPTVSARADRSWQAKAPLLENDIKKTFRKLSAGNAKYVEQALAILSTTINDGIRQAIITSQDAITEDKKFTSSLGLDDKWLLSYPSPADWTEESNTNFTQLRISGGSTKTRSQTTSHSYDVKSSLNMGLWKVQVESDGSFSHTTSSSDIDSLEISADIAKVNIMRPWFSESLFRLGHWYTNLAEEEGSISNGKMDSSNAGNLLPMYPVAFIVAKNIKIKAEFSHEDQEFIKKAVHAGTSVGFGPFSISGKYGYGHSSESFNSDFQNGTIFIPGYQVIAWVSRLTPFSPKMSTPSKEENPVVVNSDQSN